MQDNRRPMAGDDRQRTDPATESRDEADSLYAEITSLRGPGLHNNVLAELPLPRLTKMARAICPDAESDVKALRQAVCQASGRVSEADYSEAIPIMWGATEETQAEKHDDRRKKVLETLHVSLNTYNRYRRKAMAELLETKLQELYEEAQAGNEDEAGSELADEVDTSGHEADDAQTSGLPPATPPTPTERADSNPTANSEDTANGVQADLEANGFQPSLAGDKNARPEATSILTDGKAKPRLSYAIAALAALLIVGIAIADRVFDGPESQPPPLPPPGSVVNARTGHVVAGDVSRRAVPPDARIQGGSILRVCNLPSDNVCTLTGLQPPIAARAGDILEFRIRLHNPSTSPLPILHVAVLLERSSEHPRRTLALGFAGWRKPGDLKSEDGVNPVQIVFPARNNRITYLHGSTRLLDADSKSIAPLPNGMVVRLNEATAARDALGILLTDLGPPRTCSTCDPEKYTRYVSFKAKVE